jgi:hypothetical protein
MKTILLPLIFSILLSGCGLLPTKIQIVEVKIPVATVPKPPVTVKPKLELETVDIKTSGYDGYVKSLEADLVRMKTYADSLENVIYTYDVLSGKLEELEIKGKINGN